MEKCITSQFPSEVKLTVSYDEPEDCPLCHYAISPNLVGTSWYRDNRDLRHLVALYTCTHCFRPFVVHFVDGDPSSRAMEPKIDYCAPNLFSAQEFEKNVNDLSPQFVKIFNQALEAENRQLDEIAGIGYRKALEFLVKDYCKHKHPEKGDEIERLPLGKCISDLIAQPSINILASRAVWIGNDETHYTRKLEGRDISDMKTFIHALVQYVGMELTVEDAASIAPAH